MAVPARLELATFGLGISAKSIVSWLATAVSQRPLRKQNDPLEVHPHGHVPFGGFGTASWAPWLGTQYEPLVQ